MKFNLNKFKGKTLKMKVKDAVKKGKNIYKNIKGHENEINEVLIDLPFKKTGLKNLVVCMNYLYPGKVNSEFKMTRGHEHKSDEIYIFLKGKGYLIVDKKKINVKKGDIITVPINKYHRAVNTGKDKLVFLTILGKHKHSHLKTY